MCWWRPALIVMRFLVAQLGLAAGVTHYRLSFTVRAFGDRDVRYTRGNCFTSVLGGELTSLESFEFKDLDKNRNHRSVPELRGSTCGVARQRREVDGRQRAYALLCRALASTARSVDGHVT